MLNGILGAILFAFFIAGNAGAVPAPYYPDGLHPVDPPAPEGGALPGNAGLPGVGIPHPGGGGHRMPLPGIPQAPIPMQIPNPPAAFPQPLQAPVPFELPGPAIPPPLPQIQLPDVFAPLNPPPVQMGGGPGPGPGFWILLSFAQNHQQKLKELKSVIEKSGKAMSDLEKMQRDPALLLASNNSATMKEILKSLYAGLEVVVNKGGEIHNDYNRQNHDWPTPGGPELLATYHQEVENAIASIVEAKLDTIRKIESHCSELERFEEYKERVQAAEQAVAQHAANEVARVADNVKVAQASEAQVNQAVHEANEILPRVTAQMEQDAADYIRDQLKSSETIAQNAVTAAQEGAPRDTVQLLSEYDNVNKATSPQELRD